MKQFLVIIKRTEEPKQQSVFIAGESEEAYEFAKGLTINDDVDEVVLQQFAVIETIRVEKDDTFDNNENDN